MIENECLKLLENFDWIVTKESIEERLQNDKKDGIY